MRTIRLGYINMTCRGICDRYGSKNLNVKQAAATTPEGYINLYKTYRRCTECDVTMMGYEGLWCPCCRTKLRCKPRDSRTRRILVKAVMSVAKK